MATVVLPIIKALAPYVAQIATAAIPAFTSKPKEIVKIDSIIATQIDELQAAATQNAQSIHVLAEQFQQAMQGVEAAARHAKKQAAIYKAMLLFSLGLSGISLTLSTYLILN
jgi:hypothetical protein